MHVKSSCSPFRIITTIDLGVRILMEITAKYSRQKINSRMTIFPTANNAGNGYCLIAPRVIVLLLDGEMQKLEQFIMTFPASYST